MLSLQSITFIDRRPLEEKSQQPLWKKKLAEHSRPSGRLAQLSRLSTSNTKYRPVLPWLTTFTPSLWVFPSVLPTLTQTPGCVDVTVESLTDTLPGVSRKAGAVVTLQSSPAVTGKRLGAGLSSLPGTHLAAAAAVRHQRDSDRALRGRSWAEAGAVTQLAEHL